MGKKYGRERLGKTRRKGRGRRGKKKGGGGGRRKGRRARERSRTGKGRRGGERGWGRRAGDKDREEGVQDEATPPSAFLRSRTQRSSKIAEETVWDRHVGFLASNSNTDNVFTEVSVPIATVMSVSFPPPTRSFCFHGTKNQTHDLAQL